ncbi:hypothetical protein SK128_006727 [Halocaridina rubra]|uniref:Uncharacterized protein n=1 Tax=Halocaridina rubra TaxID=373956 RepID=A0AAN8XI38_HALRR
MNVDDIGQKLYKDYDTECINGDVSLWSRVKKQNKMMYISGCKKQPVKIRDQTVDLKETKNLYETPGASELGADRPAVSSLATSSTNEKIAVVDGMVLVQKIANKTGTLSTVKDLAQSLNDRLTSLTAGFSQELWTLSQSGELWASRTYKLNPMFHAYTGPDNIGKFFGIGKATCFQQYIKADMPYLEFHETTSQLGSYPGGERGTGKFVCLRYCLEGVQITSIPDLSWHLFCKKLAESNGYFLHLVHFNTSNACDYKAGYGTKSPSCSNSLLIH